MNLEDRISQLVRDALEPMLAAEFQGVEQRLIERLAGLVQKQPAAASSPPPLLTQRELARYLTVSARTLQRMIAAGELPDPIPISSGCSRWRQSDIDAWLDRRGG